MAYICNSIRLGEFAEEGFDVCGCLYDCDLARRGETGHVDPNVGSVESEHSRHVGGDQVSNGEVIIIETEVYWGPIIEGFHPEGMIYVGAPEIDGTKAEIFKNGNGYFIVFPGLNIKEIF